MILALALTIAACPEYGKRADCAADGDTLHWRGTKVRIADIDTPEIDHARCPAERARGEAAKARLIALLNARPFEVRYTGKLDRYGRTLAVIVNDGGNVGEQLVREGLARRWDGARRAWC